MNNPHNDIVLRSVRRRDFGIARKFCVEGMNVTMYTDRRFEIFLYSKYFWLMELCRATQVIGAYQNNRLVGVLLADMKGEPKAHRALSSRLYIKFAELMMGLLFGGGANSYDEANQSMYAEYTQHTEPDRELNFLAVDPELNGRGIGTQLLNELKKREPNKTVYLYTDSGCTYAFYDRRGFRRTGIRDIILLLHGKEVPLKCFLYDITL